MCDDLKKIDQLIPNSRASCFVFYLMKMFAFYPFHSKSMLRKWAQHTLLLGNAACTIYHQRSFSSVQPPIIWIRPIQAKTVYNPLHNIHQKPAPGNDNDSRTSVLGNILSGINPISLTKGWKDRASSFGYFFCNPVQSCSGINATGMEINSIE